MYQNLTNPYDCIFKLFLIFWLILLEESWETGFHKGHLLFHGSVPQSEPFELTHLLPFFASPVSAVRNASLRASV